MMNRVKIASLIVVGMLVSSNAHALIDVQAFVGKRWLSDENDDGETSGAAFQHLGIAGHISVFPFVAAGVSVGQSSISSVDKASNDIKSDTITEVSLDVMASFSMVPIITPFVRLNVPLSTVRTGVAEVENLLGDKVELKYAAEGVPLQSHYVNAGVKFSIIPLVALTVEAGTGVYMFKTTKLDQDGTDALSDEAKEADASKLDNVLVGVEVGF